MDLLWTKLRLRGPACFERWTALVSVVHNEVVLAEGLGVAELRPWENSRRPLSPQQIRRGLGTIMTELGDPTRPTQKREKGRGRAFESKSRPAVPHPVV